MRLEQLGSGAEASLAAVKPREPGLPAVSKEEKNRLDQTPAVAQPKQVAQEAAQKIVHLGASALEFSIDSESGRIVVKVIDRVTHELVRQIPMEEMLDLVKSLDQLKGLLLETKA